MKRPHFKQEAMRHNIISGKEAANQNSDKGFAVMIVIVIMLLVSFLAAQLILNVRTELKVAFNAKQRATGLALANAGVNLGLFRILDKPLSYINEDYETFHEAYEYAVYLPSGRVSYMVVNESGKIDLNRIDDSLFKIFLEYMEVEDEDQEVIVDSVKDWADSDDLHRLNGAEKDIYEELDDPYIPRNGRIQDPSEFFLVYGTDKLAKKFKARDFFTVHNTNRKINFNSLTPSMLAFLAEGDEEKMQAYRDAKEEFGDLNLSHARLILGNERFDRCSPFLINKTSNNKYYTVIAKGEPGVVAEEQEEEDLKKKKPVLTVTALVQITGSKVRYLSWQEGWS